MGSSLNYVDSTSHSFLFILSGKFRVKKSMQATLTRSLTEPNCLVSLTTDSNLSFSQGLTVAHTVALLRISVLSDMLFFFFNCFHILSPIFNTYGIVMQL